jgi:hypothetical protein
MRIVDRVTERFKAMQAEGAPLTGQKSAIS